MRLVLYLNNAEENRIDKTSFLQEVVSLTGSLRSGSSVINPQILVELDTIETLDLAQAGNEEVLGDGEELMAQNLEGSIPIFNYAYIPEFHRYYFVVDIVSVKTGLYMVSMRCDPLMSFRPSILSQTAIVERCEDSSFYDPMIRDDERPLELKKEISTEFVTQNGQIKNFSFDFSKDPSLFRYMLTTLSDSDFGWVDSEIYPPNPPALPAIGSSETTNIRGQDTYILDFETIKKLSRRLYGDSATLSFVISCVYFPFNIDEALGRSLTKNSIYCNDTPLVEKGGGASDYIEGWGFRYGPILPYLVLMDKRFPEAEDFLDLDPYKTLEIYIPFHGYEEISLQKVAGKRVILYYSLSTIDGSGSATLYDFTDSAILYTCGVQVGIPLSFSTTNQRENANAQTALALNTTIGLLSSALSVGLGIAGGHPSIAIGGAMAGIKTLNSAVTTELSIIPRAQTNIPTPKAGLMAYDKPVLRYTSTRPLFDLSSPAGAEYKRTRGVPCQKALVLSSLSGFARIGNIHLENLDATAGEISSILSLLASGVIF